ncbi:hypothetical protein RRG08_035790 [Elysia crispata]|uniref:Cystatin domain-containing protein n=1 Tax=Elysia crispata TaxID=231223 RepID=A0AAE1DIE2_9GAST|nr:hypothetical protein RRG08_035790 [Elysia crispata]
MESPAALRRQNDSGSGFYSQHVRTMLLRQCAIFVLLVYASAGYQAIDTMAIPQISQDESEYLDFAVKNVRAYFKDSKNDLPDRIELIGATARAVAGVRYEFFFLVASPKNKLSLCQASVWVRPWLTKNYITQLDDPVRCGLPESVVETLEELFNDLSNNFMYAKIIGEPAGITMEDRSIKVVDVPLTNTTCAKHDVWSGAHCRVPDTAPTSYRCSARLTWRSNLWKISELEGKEFRTKIARPGINLSTRQMVETFSWKKNEP